MTAGSVRDGGRRHRRGGRAAEPDRERGARLRPADQVRARRRDSTRSATTRRARPRPSERADRRSRSISIATLPPIVTDAERLRMALVNILTNAPPRGARRTAGTAGRARRIARSVDRRRHRRPAASRSRSATAASASPPDDLARIFDPYFTTRRTGTGLGLADFAQNIIEGLGGTITVVEHAAGAGTEVAHRTAAIEAADRQNPSHER